MSGVLLTKLWVHDAADLSSNVQLRFLNESESWPIAAEVRRYAGGRMRAVTTPGVARTVPITLKRISRDSYLDLQEMIGTDARLVMIRLPRGRKLWAIIADLVGNERTSFDLIDAAFTLQEVSHDEAL